jgi:undecaprenyl-diphosphatase
MQPQPVMKIFLLAAATLLSILVGLSRIYLGVHWPTDVLAGWCIGAAWAMLCWFVALWLQRRGEIEASSTVDPAK